MELQGKRVRLVDPRIQRRRHTGAVRGVRCRGRLRHFDGDFRVVIGETLVRPDWSGRPPFDGAPVARDDAGEPLVENLLCLVRFAGRKWIERRDVLARKHVEARHRLRERLHAEQRAVWNIAAVRKYFGYEWIESVDRRQKTRAGKESPLEQITTSDAT